MLLVSYKTRGRSGACHLALFDGLDREYFPACCSVLRMRHAQRKERWQRRHRVRVWREQPAVSVVRHALLHWSD